ncbi:MAG: hypothetical protein AAF984_08615 [Verrucomicrobiota bacterium]
MTPAQVRSGSVLVLKDVVVMATASSRALNVSSNRHATRPVGTGSR